MIIDNQDFFDYLNEFDNTIVGMGSFSGIILDETELYQEVNNAKKIILNKQFGQLILDGTKYDLYELKKIGE